MTLGALLKINLHSEWEIASIKKIFIMYHRLYGLLCSFEHYSTHVISCFFSIENEKKNRLWPFSTVFMEKARIRLSIVLRLMKNNEQN